MKNSKIVFFLNLIFWPFFCQSQSAEFAGQIRVNTDSLSNVAMRTRGAEAIWYNGTYFSWGFGGSYNQLFDPVHIGGSGEPEAGVGLLVDDDIVVDGLADLHDLTVGEEASFGKGLLSSDPIKIREIGNGPAGPEIQFMSDNSTTTVGASIKFTNATNGGNNRNLIIDNRSIVGDISFILDGDTHMRMNNGSIFSYVPLSPWITNSTDLGSTGKRWRTIYAQNALNTSDSRLKRNIESVEDVLSKVLQLNAKNYNYISDEEKAEKTIGFIAQEVEQIDPDWVIAPKSQEEYYLLNYNNFSVLAIKAIQEQQKIIDQQSSGLYALSLQVAQLNDEILKMKTRKDRENTALTEE